MADRTLQANFSASTAGFTAATNELKAKLNELNTHMEETKQAVKQANSEMKEYQKELDALEKAVKNDNAATVEQQQHMQSLKEKIAQTSARLAEVNTRIEENKLKMREVATQTKEYERELGELNRATKNGSAATTEQRQQMQALKDKISESAGVLGSLRTEQQNMQSSSRNLAASLRDYQKELQNLRKETSNGANATDEQRRRMQELRDNIARTASQVGTMRTTEQELRSQINSTNRELQNQQTAAEQVKSAAADMGDVLKANLWSSAIQTAVSKLLSSLKQAAEYCYTVGSSFEAGMSQVSAISGATSSELDQLAEKAKELGASTKFTATQVSEAMNYMAMAGWDAQQMLSGIEGVMNLAAAAGGDLAQTSDIVTDAITAFGLAAEDVGHFSDVLAASSANANTNVAMMGETFSYCAPIAGALGFSIEDVSEAIGLMANSGVKSSMAGTALRTLFTKLSDDVKITGQNLGEVTIQTSNADGSMRSLKDIMTDMRGAFSQLTQSEKSAAAESIVGKYAMTGLLTLMNAGEGDVNKLRTAIEECDGATSQMAETMQDNGRGAVTIFQSALEGLGIAVYDKFSDHLKDTVNGMTDFISDLTERIESGGLDATFERMAQSLGHASDELVRFASDVLPVAIEGLANFITFVIDFRDEIGAAATGITTFMGLLGAQKVITAAVASFKALKTAITGAKVAQEGLNAASAANPFGIVAAAIGVLVSGVIALASAMDDCNDRMRDAIDNARDAADASEDYASKADKLSEIRDKYKEIKDSTADAKTKEEELQALQDELESQFGRMADGINLVTGAFDDQTASIDTLISKYSDLSDRELERSITSLENGQKESTAIGLNTAAVWDSESIAANQYFISRAKAHGADTKFANMYGGTAYFEWDYEKRSRALRAVADDMIDMYNKTGIEAYNTIAQRIEAEIPSVQEGADQLKELRQERADRLTTKPATQSNKTPITGSRTVAEEERRKGEKAQNSAHNDYLDTLYGEGASGVDWTDMSSIKRFYKYQKDTDKITDSEYYDYLEKYGNELLQKDSDEWRSLMAEIYQGRKSISEKGAGKSGGTKKDPNEEQYDSDKKYLKWRLDMGYITEAEYYEQLAKLRDKYLDESSDKWRSATLEIHNYEKQKNKEKLDDIQKQYDSAIAAIDAEIKLHEREKEDEDVDKKIADIDRQLQYDRLDGYSRSQLEKKKQDLLDEKEETQWQRDHEDLKEGLETVYTMAQTAYEDGSAKLQDALMVASGVFGAIGNGATQTAAAMNTVTNNNVSLVMNAVSQSAGQIALAVVRLLTSGI